ncbi:nucleotide exchange factor GrpE [Rhabdothermincola sediminis]|uniref:nucleotide exchange factor GrpE n=1 Tax=Rhabdothermincola sediminis TaxID=2751370 RepID=UPI001AA07E96|nr:nucleotide exchange factor GrpE [Rhabdothermincola sediminis]
MEPAAGAPEGPLGPAEAATDDELLEAAAVAEGEPAAAAAPSEEAEAPAAVSGAPSEGEEEAAFVDGTVGRSDLAAERDEYLEALQRVKAEFDNFKRRTSKERVELIDRANAQLVDKLLPVLDACEAALGHGAESVEPIYKSLLDTLEKEGLERMEPVDRPFDPNLHEAVLHEQGDGGEPVVVESMRTGYLWKGQVLRPAMVKVRD